MKRILTLLCAWLAGLSLAAAQTIDPTFRPGEVTLAGGVTHVVQQPDSGRVVVGRFTLADNTPVLNVVRYLPDGNLDYDFLQRLGPVTFTSNNPSIQRLANGQLLLSGAGDITTPTLQRRNLMRLQADGTPDPSFNAGVSGGGYLNTTLELPDGKLLVGGSFTSFNGSSFGGLVRLLPNGQLDPTFQPALSSPFTATVWALALQPDGKLLVGGDFTSPARDLVRLLPDGQWDPTFVAAAGTDNSTSGGTVARTLALQPDGKVLVGGRVANEFGGRRGGLLRLLPTGTLDASFQPPAGIECFGNTDNQRVHLLPDGRIVLNTTSYAARPVLRLLPTGALDATFQLGNADLLPSYGTVDTWQRLPNGHWLLGGNFARYAGQAGCLFELDADGRFLRRFRPRIGNLGTVSCLARQANGQILVGGSFSWLNGYPADNLGRLHANGEPDSTFAQQCAVNGAINALQLLPSGQILVAGTFRRVGAVALTAVARLSANGLPDAQFVPFPLPQTGTSTPTIYNLKVLGSGDVLAAGSFYDSQGNFQSAVARIDAAGRVDDNWGNVAVPGRPGLLAVQADGKVLVGGQSLVRLTAGGSPDPGFQYPGTGTNVIYGVLPQPDGRVLVAGQLRIGGVDYHVVRLLADGSMDPAFAAVQRFGVSPAPTRLFQQADGRILVGGARPSSGNTTYLYRLQADGTPDTDIATGPNNTIMYVATVVELPGGALLLGGNFAELNGYQSFSLLSLRTPAITASGTARALPRAVLYPNPARDFCRVALPVGFSGQLTLLDATGRAVRTQTLTRAESQAPVDLRGVPAGVYWLRIDGPTGPVGQRLVVK